MKNVYLLKYHRIGYLGDEWFRYASTEVELKKLTKGLELVRMHGTIENSRWRDSLGDYILTIKRLEKATT